jgi:hypothetical protein
MALNVRKKYVAYFMEKYESDRAKVQSQPGGGRKK